MVVLKILCFFLLSRKILSTLPGLAYYVQSSPFLCGVCEKKIISMKVSAAEPGSHCVLFLRV